jgi:hypothetical protein
VLVVSLPTGHGDACHVTGDEERAEHRDRRDLGNTSGDDRRRVVARLHEPEQRAVLADEQEHERADGEDDASRGEQRDGRAAEPPPSRSIGSRRARPMTVAPAKFRTNSVPIVGTVE